MNGTWNADAKLTQPANPAEASNINVYLFVLERAKPPRGGDAKPWAQSPLAPREDTLRVARFPKG